jgi:hypothetical protein
VREKILHRQHLKMIVECKCIVYPRVLEVHDVHKYCGAHRYPFVLEVDVDMALAYFTAVSLILFYLLISIISFNSLIPLECCGYHLKHM